MILLASPFIQVQAIDVSQESIYEGPFLEKLLFKFILEEDLVSALDESEIDIIGDVLDPSFLDAFQWIVETEPIDVSEYLRNGYGLVSFNCEKYPFKISQFRCAVAYVRDCG